MHACTIASKLCMLSVMKPSVFDDAMLANLADKRQRNPSAEKTKTGNRNEQKKRLYGNRN
jgi:hypothetical protein